MLIQIPPCGFTMVSVYYLLYLSGFPALSKSHARNDAHP